jgi:hypothetical protein
MKLYLLGAKKVKNMDTHLNVKKKVNFSGGPVDETASQIDEPVED